MLRLTARVVGVRRLAGWFAFTAHRPPPALHPVLAAAPAGDGSPLKRRWLAGSGVFSTLKRASRRITHTMNSTAITTVALYISAEVSFQPLLRRRMRKAGAAPKLMASHRLSSWPPKSL